MDGENNGKPYLNGWFGGTTIFGNTIVLFPPVFGLGIFEQKHATCWWMSHTGKKKTWKPPTIVKGGCSGIRDVPKFSMSRCFNLCFFCMTRPQHVQIAISIWKKHIQAFMRSCGSILYFKPEISSKEISHPGTICMAWICLIDARKKSNILSQIAKWWFNGDLPCEEVKNHHTSKQKMAMHLKNSIQFVLVWYVLFLRGL